MINEARTAINTRLLADLSLKSAPFTTKWQVSSADLPCAYVRFGNIHTRLVAIGQEHVYLNVIIDIITEYRGQNELHATIVKTESIIDSVLETLSVSQVFAGTDFVIDMGTGISVSGISEMPYGESCWGVSIQFVLEYPKNRLCRLN